MRNALLLLLLTMLSSLGVTAQQDVLHQQIAAIVKDADGSIGVAMSSFDNMDTLMVAANKHFPMQSVYKFPLAMAVLDQVDKGKLSLAQKLHVSKQDLLPKTWSPLRDKYPDGGELPLSEILAFTVSNSDNNGCDILFRLIGGPAKVNAYVHNIGVNDIAIVSTEEEMAKEWKAQYENYATPSAMLQLLAIFFKGKHLSKTSNDFLWKLMVETTTGADKIKGSLPGGTLVAHKTGASSTSPKGVIAAANDVGIVALPNGKYFAIVVFVSDTVGPVEKCNATIARISRAAFDYYSFAKE